MIEILIIDWLRFGPCHWGWIQWYHRHVYSGPLPQGIYVVLDLATRVGVAVVYNMILFVICLSVYMIPRIVLYVDRILTALDMRLFEKWIFWFSKINVIVYVIIQRHVLGPAGEMICYLLSVVLILLFLIFQMLQRNSLLVR
jgi:hypothetical protein